ncbi:MAG: alkaline shock response membrane anchor protein AmaP [Flavobacteriales bacterium]|nr:alkaline shock response membrane anchor protein AmaP [Flavobacteriales bacterium]
MEITPLTSAQSVTEMAFEVEQIPESIPEPREMLTASMDPELESLLVVKHHPRVQRAKRILRKTEHTLRSLPFAEKALSEVNFSALDPQKPQVNGLKFIINGCIILGVAALLGILGIVLSIVVVLSGSFPWPLIFNYIGLLLFFGGAAFLVVGIIFRVREKGGT